MVWQGISRASPTDPYADFNRFERASTAPNLGGLGLGLYISRQIADAHGGTLRADSGPGRGATFTLSVPAAGPRE